MTCHSPARQAVPSNDRWIAMPENDDVYQAARDKIEGAARGGDKTGGEASARPAAGPHAKLELTNNSATPGTGALPRSDEDEVDASTG
jgi:hypothetical protein